MSQFSEACNSMFCFSHFNWLPGGERGTYVQVGVAQMIYCETGEQHTHCHVSKKYANSVTVWPELQAHDTKVHMAYIAKKDETPVGGECLSAGEMNANVRNNQPIFQAYLPGAYGTLHNTGSQQPHA